MFGLFKKKKTNIEPQFYAMNCSLNCPRDEKKCPLWKIMYKTTITEDGKERIDAVGNCSFAWIPDLLVEINQSIKGVINNGNTKKA